jgi:ribonuclease-3
LEAVIAAIYLDSDFIQVQTCILVWFKPLLDTLSLDMMQKDSKTQLQEFLQAKKLELPQYAVTAIEGESHDQQFTVSCVVVGSDSVAVGEGPSRRKAEQEAARRMLEILKNEC